MKPQVVIPENLSLPYWSKDIRDGVYIMLQGNKQNACKPLLNSLLTSLKPEFTSVRRMTSGVMVLSFHFMWRWISAGRPSPGKERKGRPASPSLKSQTIWMLQVKTSILLQRSWSWSWQKLMNMRTADIDNYWKKRQNCVNLPLTSCMEKWIYGGTYENKLVLRHPGKPFVSIMDVTGITANNGGKNSTWMKMCSSQLHQ